MSIATMVLLVVSIFQRRITRYKGRGAAMVNLRLNSSPSPKRSKLADLITLDSYQIAICRKQYISIGVSAT
jgi:hypothetical protein